MIVSLRDTVEPGMIVTAALAYDCYPFTCPSEDQLKTGLSPAGMSVMDVKIPVLETHPALVLEVLEPMNGALIRHSLLKAFGKFNDERLIDVHHVIILSVELGRPAEPPSTHTTIRVAAMAIAVAVIGFLIIRMT